MSTIFSPDVSARILSAMEAVTSANNGYADIGMNPKVAEALRAAGFVVLASKNLHGTPTFRGFTQAAQKALAGAPYAVSIYKDVPARVEQPDFEGAILARQEAAGHLD